jgi:hypothetical protein
MRRSWSTRLLAAFLAFWLPLCLADAGVVHVCAMHEAAGSAAMPMMDMGPGHGAQSHTANMPSGHHDGAPGQQRCTCMGPCTASTGVAASPEVRLPDIAAVASRGTPAVKANDEPRAAEQVRLPFAMGPPASSRTL